MCRSWRAIRKAGQHSDGANVQILLRVLLFGIYVFMGVIISALSNTERNSPVPDLFAATSERHIPFSCIMHDWSQIFSWPNGILGVRNSTCISPFFHYLSYGLTFLAFDTGCAEGMALLARVFLGVVSRTMPVTPLGEGPAA
jgi:hypothetical protein